MRAAVPELSGLVKSHKHPGVFWAHADSGNDAALWAIDAMGRTLGRYAINTKNQDWEDIAADSDGNLYLADTGDNFRMRDDVWILRVREPDKIRPHGKLKVSATQHFRYPNAANGERRHFDAEALFFAAGRLHLLNKDRMSTVSTLYRLPTRFGSDGQVAAELVSHVDLRVSKTQGSAPVTAADVSRDGTRVALTTNKHLYVFRFDGTTLREQLYLSRLPKKEGIEALAFDGVHLLAGREDGSLVALLLPLHAQPGQK